ncbi:MAG: DUF5106 domain-containing protein [Tannerella sp.]|jgi:hypothetical protein|nr:DUF5106 domain-containing protein [Tannerella sp.]
MKKGYLIAILCSVISIVLFTECTKKPQVPTKKTFPMVEVPVIYTDPQTRAEYLAMHFWDKFDFNDTAYVESATLISEQAIADYLSALPYASYDVIYKGIKHTLDMASQNKAMYIYFYTVMSHYLFDNMNSPLRNYEFYIPVLEHMLASEHLDERRKARPRILLTQLTKNRPGTKATDIHFTTSAGAKKALYDIKSDYTLLMFHSIECDACKELTKAIDASEVIKALKNMGKITVLAIYPGPEVDEWKKYQAGMPAWWTKGYDHDAEIDKQETYALFNIPSLYLLDKDHMVIMKETSLYYVEYYLANMLNLPMANTPVNPEQTVQN